MPRLCLLIYELLAGRGIFRASCRIRPEYKERIYLPSFTTCLMSITSNEVIENQLPIGDTVTQEADPLTPPPTGSVTTLTDSRAKVGEGK